MKGFDDFPTHRKVEIIFQQAEFINGIDYNHYTFMLYQLDAFFFEVRYDRPLNEIIEMKIAEQNFLHLYCPTLCELL